jgi:hypothetical protein
MLRRDNTEYAVIGCLIIEPQALNN